jgi:hypothetical protein
MSFFHHRCLYPFVDYVLTSKEKKEFLDELLQDKCIFYTDPPKEVLEKLSTAKVLYLYPDSFDQWTDILLVLQEKKPLPVKLFLIADSDVTFSYEHLEPMFAFFDKAEFWIQNWLGTHPRATLLPIGMSDILPSVDYEKQTQLGISFLHHYKGCESRDEFFAYLHTHPELLAYCFPKVPFQTYCQLVAKCCYHTCVMGEGPDTFRFWESLALGCLPVVKENAFYDSLADHYPNIPMLRLSSWDELLEETMQEPPAFPHMPYLYESYWISKLKQMKE